MNYRHVYHAGNFADVLKHAALAHIIAYLKRKPQPFRVIDTHAGTGVYDLGSAEAQKTGEWRDGIGRILADTPPRDVAEILQPYLDVVLSENGHGASAEDAAREAIVRYPGSPLLARRLLRSGDKLVVNEAHPEDGARLKTLFTKDGAVKVLTLDGWMALKSLLPPQERRGVVLIDPPFEEAGEFHRLVDALAEAHRRFATGTIVIWYPIKDPRRIRAFHRDAAALAIPKLLVAELCVRAPLSEGALAGTGLLILNPPFTLEAALKTLLPYLVRTLGQARDAESRLEWLTGERTTSA